MTLKNILPKLFLLMIFHINLFAQNGWTAKQSLPLGSLYGAASFSIGTKGYIVTGEDNAGASAKLWEYDQASGSWTMKANFPGTARIHGVAFSIGNKGYVGTGLDGVGGALLNDFWEWDQATNTWSQKANFPGTPRKFAVAFAANGKGYIGTGWDINVLKNDFWEYDPASNSWTAKANYPIVCYAASAFVINNKGYVCSGYDGNTTYVYPNSFYEYNATSNTWVARASLPSSGTLTGSGRNMAFSFSTNSKGYIGTGVYVNLSQTGPMPVYCQDFWEWDQPTNTWTQRTNFPGGNRQWTIGFGLGNKGYAGTGEAGLNYFNDLWEWGSSDTIVHTGVNQLNTSGNVAIYPNPASDYVTISKTSTKQMNIQVFDAVGSLVYQTTINNHQLTITRRTGAREST